jgi:hypothetical protein
MSVSATCSDLRGMSDIRRCRSIYAFDRGVLAKPRGLGFTRCGRMSGEPGDGASAYASIIPGYRVRKPVAGHKPQGDAYSQRNAERCLITTRCLRVVCLFRTLATVDTEHSTVYLPVYPWIHAGLREVETHHHLRVCVLTLGSPRSLRFFSFSCLLLKPSCFGSSSGRADDRPNRTGEINPHNLKTKKAGI